ncbi:hypothetical protein RYA05_00960 [Pseudomonas syringae pv. actinidiae]|nr:hypothetical protein [Pseudomonas syringae pv. actinidiae]
MTDIFIPSKVKIGFSTPWDQPKGCWGFNGSVLFHAAHYNRKGTLNGSKRFDQECHSKYKQTECANKPQSGFSIGYRHIDVDNDTKTAGMWVKRPDNSYLHLCNEASSLLLANAEISAGQIKGQCVMGWSNGDVYLLPVGSPAHAKACTFTEDQHVTIRQKDLIPGCIYARKLDSKTAVYLGRLNMTNIVGHSTEAANKSLGERSIFYFEGVWQVMSADSLFKKVGNVSDVQLTKLVDDYEKHQNRTKLGDVIFCEPNFKDVINRMGDETFILDFALPHEEKYYKVANMRFEKALNGRPGILFLNHEGVFHDQQFEKTKFELLPLQRVFLEQLKASSLEALLSSPVQFDISEYLSNLQKKMTLMEIKIICRKVGNHILPLNTPRCNELTGLLTGVNPQDNAWALD